MQPSTSVVIALQRVVLPWLRLLGAAYSPEQEKKRKRNEDDGANMN